jgi:hypothetical protein
MPEYDSSRFDPPAPLARVGLRNPDSGKTVSDIPMLIDSGADASLVPCATIDGTEFANRFKQKLRVRRI